MGENKLKEQTYPEFNQTIVRGQLGNGMAVVLIPMKAFQKSYAVLTTDFGSIDQSFYSGPNRELVQLPAGCAHFLEHKLFEKEDHDAFDLFGKLGADSNAFTSYTQTSYQFSTTMNLHQCLEILLDFVQKPYFSKEGVAKEQGIIGQEIRMYADSPSSRLYTGTVANLYPHDPMRQDIAGSEDSIAQITPDVLYRAYNEFYRPSNLKLVVAGNIDPHQLFEWLEEQEAQYSIDRAPLPQRALKLSDPLDSDLVEQNQLMMDVQRPHVMVALRGSHRPLDAPARLKYRLSVELLLEMLFDDTTDNFLRLYDRGILDDSFSFSFEMERGFHFATWSTETNQPRKFTDEIRAILQAAPDNLMHMKGQFAAMRRGAVGRLVAILNSPEMIANRYASNLFGDITIYDELKQLQSLTLTDLQTALDQFICPAMTTTFTIWPQAEH